MTWKQNQEDELESTLFFIIGDMQGGDKLCASAPVYSNTLKRLCHACDVAGADAGNPHVVCQRIVSHDIEDCGTDCG